MSLQAKTKARDFAFRYVLPLVIRPTQNNIKNKAYERNHASANANQNAFVPRFVGGPLTNLPVKIVAFYLPQFHRIPENDEWWGEGFTEWTNVRSARPQFKGHYQPKIPGSLGYYDLLDHDTFRQQIDLARLYGIGGFCFYFYWFGGRRLLEKPAEAYLRDSTLELPFCLCWANENWSRRWDGLAREILIAQNHSAEDDIAFIAAVSEYLSDPRYIRIDGKPLLVVYRPNLIPDPKATSDRWRSWCRNNGLGEIFLAYTQSFEAVDPAVYGFDGAIEFPPNNSRLPVITRQMDSLSADFRGVVYDWTMLVERSEEYSDPDYCLFRSTCPSWDNTARLKKKGTVFFNSSPDLYRRWLENSILDTITRFPQSDYRMVFVNAWNEWAEGAYLEPDAHHGYAYLQATRDALEQAAYAKSI